MELGFYLKKIVAYFVEPFGMFLVLFVVGMYYLFINKKSSSKLFLSLAFLFMLLFSYPPFANYLVENLENQYPKYDYSKSANYIHVLGNGHNVDPDQPLSSQITSAGVKRDLEGVLIHLNMEGSKLIFTGFKGKTNISNAKMNSRLAMALGVSEQNIIINESPRDTREEAEFTKTIVKDEPFILVTSATHMPRAMILFESMGLKPIAAPTSFYKSDKNNLLVLPNIGSFEKSQIAIHEYIGIFWSKINLYINTIPKLIKS